VNTNQIELKNQHKPLFSLLTRFNPIGCFCLKFDQIQDEKFYHRGIDYPYYKNGVTTWIAMKGKELRQTFTDDELKTFHAQKECVLCARIPPKETLKLAHKVFNMNHSLARTIGKEAITLLKRSYKIKSVLFCGRTKKSILGGLFCLLALKYDQVITFYEVAKRLNVSTSTIRTVAQLWFSEHEEWFPELERCNRYNRRLRKKEYWAGLLNFAKTAIRKAEEGI